MMAAITLRPAEPERDFGRLAELFSLEQDEPTTAPELTADYQAHQERVIRLTVAGDGQGELCGFNWCTRSRSADEQAYCYLIVAPDNRGRGVGSRLYRDLEGAARGADVRELQIGLRDIPANRGFAERRGFVERSRHVVLALDLRAFDDRRYDVTIAALEREGFRFTSLKDLGDTEESRRRLYVLNDTTGMDEPGADGTHSWASFEDFRERVCRSDWYQPGGQLVAIDTARNVWAGMCAITRFPGAGHAQVLHSGVDRLYRGRKLGQALKALALRYAREALKVDCVRTRHHAANHAAIAISNKMGFAQVSGTCEMAKRLE